MPKKAKKPDEATVRFAELKAQWEARRRDPKHASGGDWLVEKLELELDAVPFLATLRRLGHHLQDQRFLDLHRDLVMSHLIDRETGKWSRYGTTVANPMTRDMCEMIQDLIAGKTSERLAIAEAVAELAISAPSFEAACKSVKRVLDQARKLVRQKPG
jgi:hypothetical protein